MGLVYFITGLPELHLGAPPPLDRQQFVRRCLTDLRGDALAEVKRLLRIESVEETVRLSLASQLDVEAQDATETRQSSLPERRDPIALEDLPEWVHAPLLQHQLMRRHYYELRREAKTQLLRAWANFKVDLEEIKTALLCRQTGLSREAFLSQMQGSFDASAPLIMRHWEEPRLGLGNRFPWMTELMDALHTDDMAESERRLIELEWRRIEQLYVPDLFSAETVISFYLRLRLAERQSSWRQEHGEQKLEQILNVDIDGALEAQRAI